MELGYTIPKKWLETMSIQNVRVYMSAYNLLTVTKLKYMDPEFYLTPNGGGLGDIGYNYPINKTVTVGINVKF